MWGGFVIQTVQFPDDEGPAICVDFVRGEIYILHPVPAISGLCESFSGRGGAEGDLIQIFG